MITESVLVTEFQKAIDVISTNHSIDCTLQIILNELTEEDTYMNPEMFMYADEWFSVLIKSSNFNVVFTLCVCTKLYTGETECTYASINSAFVCPELEGNGISTEIVGVLDRLRKGGYINKVVVSDRSDILDDNVSVWDKIFNKYPELIKEEL